MTIKEELKLKRKQAELEKEKSKNKANEDEILARKLIEEFIIPEFRKMSEENPYASTFEIQLIYGISIGRSHNSYSSTYVSYIDFLIERISENPYSEKIVLKAVDLAHEFEIDAKKIKTGLAERYYEFKLDLS